MNTRIETTLQNLHDACEYWEDQNDPVLVEARDALAEASDQRLDTSEYEIPIADEGYNHPEEGNMFIESVDDVEVSHEGQTFYVTTNPPDIETMTEYDYSQEISIEIFIPFL